VIIKGLLKYRQSLCIIYGIRFGASNNETEKGK